MYAKNVALPAFADECVLWPHAAVVLAMQQLIDISYQPDPQQQSHRTQLQQANRTDRRTDKW